MSAVQDHAWNQARDIVGRRQRRSTMVLLGLLACLACALVASAMSGAVDTPWRVAWAILTNSNEGIDPIAGRVLAEIRLPRVLFGAIAGAALAVTGVAMQALFRNP